MTVSTAFSPMPIPSIGDPRVWPPAEAAPVDAAALHALAASSLGAATGQDSDRDDARVQSALTGMVDAGEGEELAEVFSSAPSAAIYRHLWRLLARAETTVRGDAITMTLFAFPLAIVAGLDDAQAATVTLPGTLPDASAVSALLREHGALRGNQAFSLVNALANAASIDIAALPRLLSWRTLAASDGAQTSREVAPAPIRIAAGEAGVHLRFLLGSALAAPGAALLADAGTGKWGIPLTRELGRQMTPAGVSLLVLPQAPAPLCAALARGRAMQREVSAQLFASNAIRRLRASTGEPVAVVSAHRAPDAPCGGELRVSLSSVFDPAAAEGFRCPLYPSDSVGEVAEMLIGLMRDCRVPDVRVLPGVHGDRDPESGLLLLFKGDAVPPAPLH